MPCSTAFNVFAKSCSAEPHLLLSYQKEPELLDDVPMDIPYTVVRDKKPRAKVLVISSFGQTVFVLYPGGV